MKLLFRAGALMALFLPSVAGAQAPSVPPAKISAAEATAIALKVMPGNATSVVIERKGGKHVYVVEIQTPNSGEKDVFVDMESGAVVGRE